MRGRCLCGSVNYAIGGEAASGAIFHRTHCQKQTGTSVVWQGAALSSALELRGDLKSFRDIGHSGKPVDRFFCPYCGSPIYASAQLKPDLSFVVDGTLSEPAAVAPTVQTYCSSAQPWQHLAGLQSFPARGR